MDETILGVKRLWGVVPTSVFLALKRSGHLYDSWDEYFTRILVKALEDEGYVIEGSGSSKIKPTRGG